MVINRKSLWWMGIIIMLVCFTSSYSLSQPEEKGTLEVKEKPVASTAKELEKGESKETEESEPTEELFLEVDEELLEFTAEELEFEILDDVNFLEIEEVPEEEKELAPSERLVNLIFKDADVTNVLAGLAQQTGMNIIWGDEVKGVVTLRLENVPWKQALEMLLRANKLAAETEGSIIRVTTIARLNEEKEALLKLAIADREKQPLVTEVLTLNFSEAAEAKASLERVLTSRGSIVVDIRTNSLVINDIVSNIPELKRVAGLIDTRTPQVMIEARIVETSATFVRELGIDWAIKGSKLVPTHYKGSALDPILDKLLGSETTITDEYTATTTGGVTTESDIYKRSMASPESEERREKRSEIDHKGGVFRSHFLENLYDDEGNLKTYGGLFKLGVLDAYDFQVAVRALDAEDTTKILSNPRVATLHSREAYILVGEKVPIQKALLTETGMRYSIEFEDVGTTLKVTAKVNKEDMVNLKIQPEVSEVGAWKQLTAGEYPIIKTKRADVEVLVKSGNTVVIGGLIYEKTIATEAKIPLLGDIPILGWAFKKRRREKEDKEILVFVTPTVFGQEEKEKMAKDLMIDFEGEDAIELIEKQQMEGEEEQKAFAEIEKEIEEIEREEEFGKVPKEEKTEDEEKVTKEEAEPEERLEIERF